MPSAALSKQRSTRKREVLSPKPHLIEKANTSRRILLYLLQEQAKYEEQADESEEHENPDKFEYSKR